jgi:hypothetical protein
MLSNKLDPRPKLKHFVGAYLFFFFFFTQVGAYLGLLSHFHGAAKNRIMERKLGRSHFSGIR